MERWLRSRLGSCCTSVQFRRLLGRYENGCGVEHAAIICGLQWTIRSRVRDFDAVAMVVEVISIKRSQPPRNLLALNCCSLPAVRFGTVTGGPVIAGPKMIMNGAGDWPCKW